MQFKSKYHKEFDKCEHIVLPLKDIDINNVDEAFYLYIIEHNKKFGYYRVKCQFILAFNDYGYSSCKLSILFDNKTMISCKKILENVIEVFTDKGFNFNHFPETHIMISANKSDMTYAFYIKHNMHAVEWKIKEILNKNHILTNEFYRNWTHPSNRKFESYRV